jgi:Icc-related predicted phosphoesterase
MKIKLLFISDTHTMHEGLANKFPLPAADFLIHAGDITGRGSEHTIRKFLKWFGELRLYEHKIFIAGNHDWLFESSPGFARKLVKEYANRYKDRGEIIYLEDSGVERWGLNFWGSPVTRPFYDWAFNRPESKLAQHWSAIPDDTDVLITHDPPYMIMDYSFSGSEEHCGSPSLWTEITKRIKPKVHVFGHIHEQYGIKVIGETTFINASNLDGAYDIVNPPVLLEIDV